MKTFTVNSTEHGCSELNDTTYYHGYYSLNGLVFSDEQNTDRGRTALDDVAEYIAKQCGIPNIQEDIYYLLVYENIDVEHREVVITVDDKGEVDIQDIEV